MTTKRWYVVQAHSGFEKVVAQVLRDRIREKHIEEKFGEILVPIEEVVELKDGKKRRSERKFFPGYVFVEMEMDDETWHLVKQTPKVSGFIGATTGEGSDKPKRPSPLSDKEAEAIFQRMQDSSEKPKPKVLFEAGEVVRVIEGPFADFNGVVEEVNYEKSRLRVAVLIFGRSTPVELQFDQVEKG
jgi:transcriptional antiterminator NusG